MAEMGEAYVRVKSDTVGTARAVIDDIDTQLIAWLQARRAVSQSLQAKRAASGLARTDLRREKQLIARWRDELGDAAAGGLLALDILHYCKRND